MTSEIFGFGTDSLRNIAKNCLPEYEARFVLYAADKINALRAENESLLFDNNELRQQVTYLEEDKAKLTAEVGRLRAALEKADHDAEQLFDALNECHDRHNEHCDFWRWGKPCDCGSDAALAEHLARIDALCVGDA